MAIARGVFGQFEPVLDGSAATPDPAVFGRFGKFVEVWAESAPTIFPGVFTAVIQYQPPTPQPLPTQVVGY